MEAVTAVKVNVLFSQAKYRDYYDFYMLAKALSLRQIFDLSKEVIEGLTYKLFCVSLLYIDDIADDNIILSLKKTLVKNRFKSFLRKG